MARGAVAGHRPQGAQDADAGRRSKAWAQGARAGTAAGHRAPAQGAAARSGRRAWLPVPRRRARGARQLHSSEPLGAEVHVASSDVRSVPPDDAATVVARLAVGVVGPQRGAGGIRVGLAAGVIEALHDAGGAWAERVYPGPRHHRGVARVAPRSHRDRRLPCGSTRAARGQTRKVGEDIKTGGGGGAGNHSRAHGRPQARARGGAGSTPSPSQPRPARIARAPAPIAARLAPLPPWRCGWMARGATTHCRPHGQVFPSLPAASSGR